MSYWQLQDAKARFSELVKRAQREGPQTVTVHGERAAVVVSAEEYDRLAPPRNLVDVLCSGPEWPEEAYEAINDRIKDLPREIEF